MRLKFCLLAVLGCSALLPVERQVKAGLIEINNVNVSLAGSTANDNTSTNNRRTSSAAVVDAGGSTTATLGAMVDGLARFAMAIETRNASGALGTLTNDFNANFTVTFDVVADPFVGWDLEISNSRQAVFMTSSGGGTAKADITGSTTLVNANPAATLNLPDQGSLTAENSSAEVNNNSGTLVISGFGTQSFTTNSTWNAEADSTQGFFAQGDKVGVLMGADIAFSRTDSQINYVGGNPTLGHTLAGDGHRFAFKVTVTQVPEPSSALLVLSGLVGLVGFRRRAC